MKLIKQVCTLSQAKKLKELGIEQLAYFAFQGDVEYEPDLKSDDGQNYSAFNVAELGNMITSKYTRLCKDFDIGWRCLIEGTNGGDLFVADGTEAQVRAATLIHLIEQNMVDVEACNKRLVV